MRPPADLPPLLVALAEAYARRAGIDPGDFWAYAYRKAAPPPELRDALVAAFFPLVPPDSFLPHGLTSSHDLATLDGEMQATHVKDNRQTRVSRARLRKANRKHPFVEALVAQGKTVTEFAKELGYARSTVQSWYDRDADNARPIPRRAAEAIEKKLGIPVSVWAKTTD